MAEPENLVVPIFKVHSKIDKTATAKEGRPIYTDLEIVEIKLAANKQTTGVFPAHAVWKWVDQPNGMREPVTYAMRFNEQYKRFKANSSQSQTGTPVEELPFLTQGKRLELKALNIHTAETLASLDGQPLKNLGMGGRELKNMAQAYLDNAAASADTTRLASENEKLRQLVEEMKQDAKNASQAKDKKADERAASPFDDMEKDDIKNWIEEATGERPRGNPNKDTLVGMADEINAKLAKKPDEAA